MKSLTLGITAGDPCGIGPEVILKALGSKQINRRVHWVVIGNALDFKKTAQYLRHKHPARISFIDCPSAHSFRPGESSAASGLASLEYLNESVRLWRKGLIQGVVTASITKWAIQKSFPSFVGHTEYFAKATRTRSVVMLFAAEKLRVVVLTRHIPLKAVSRVVTKSLLASAIRMIATSLKRDFGISKPRVVVCGINPHAGEGRPASEESKVLLPVIKALRREGIRCEGPVAADGFFAGPVKQDVVIAPYHDQGLIPFKIAARDSGCQVTVGLPFIRTSPDHGSALDIAGQGIADPGSMIYALNLAAKLVVRRHAHSR